MITVEESSALDGCQHADSVSSDMEIGYPTEEERTWVGRLRAIRFPARSKGLSSKALTGRAN